MSKKLIALFNNDRDLQIALNSMVQAGFDSGNVSLVMLDSKKKDTSTSEFYDEEDAFGQAKGTIWTADAEDMDTEAFSVPGIGNIVVAGPVLSKVDRTEYNDTDSKDSRFYDILKDLDIEDQEVGGIEQRIKGGQILAVVNPAEEDLNEIAMIFSDNGGDLMNYDMAMN